MREGSDLPSSDAGWNFQLRIEVVAAPTIVPGSLKASICRTSPSSRQQIALRFLLQGLRVSIVGCLLGLGLAGVSVRLLSGMLYGVSSFDPATFGGVVVLVLLVAALATILPAARAARTDPMRVLRDE